MPSLNELMVKDGYYRIKVTTKQPETVCRTVLADGTIKISLRATPEQGRANAELLKFIASELGKTFQVRLVSVMPARSRSSLSKNYKRWHSCCESYFPVCMFF